MAFTQFNKHLAEVLCRNKASIISKLIPHKSGVNITITANYAMKNPVPIKWVRPEKIPCYKPQKSGDLKPLIEIDTTQLPPEFQELEELKDADENIRKLFSLEFQPYQKTVSVLREKYLERVKRHNLDMSSAEARLAKMTADIRDMQRFVEQFPHDKRTRVRLKETIDKRKRLLRFLRRMDYKCFEYVIEKLDLVYKPFPGPDVYKRVERKRSLRMLTQKYCENIVDSKLAQYRESLEAQQEDFLVEKIKTLKWIKEEEVRLNVDPTVSDKHIKSAEEKLENLKSKKKIEDVQNE